ncbi:MAG: cyclic pyranopterin phosphate synthase [Parasphingorhabdus sp.]|jgi:cyclic pyranopterin phosphate synthase
MQDALGRPIHDLRISITDRCNFRCVYCMPKSKFGRNYKFLPRKELLSYEEIVQVSKAFIALGVEKIRVTGGEPLLRSDITELLGSLSQLDGLKDLSLTTNASLVSPEKARALRDAGLMRVNISLDSLNDEDFERINDVGCSVSRVLKGIDALDAAGFDPIKINMVVRKGLNENSIMPMARHFHGSRHILRFIEYMDVGTTNEWRRDQVVSSREIVDLIGAELPLQPISPNYRGEVAKRWRYQDGGGEIGLISSVTQPFCGSCSRARISAVGELYLCLFASSGFDLREKIRAGCDDEELRTFISQIWSKRDDRYSELRAGSPNVRKVEMSHIGG